MSSIHPGCGAGHAAPRLRSGEHPRGRDLSTAALADPVRCPTPSAVAPRRARTACARSAPAARRPGPGPATPWSRRGRARRRRTSAGVLPGSPRSRPPAQPAVPPPGPPAPTAPPRRSSRRPARLQSAAVRNRQTHLVDGLIESAGPNESAGTEAGPPVEQLSGDVQVAGVTCGLLDQMQDHLADVGDPGRQVDADAPRAAGRRDRGRPRWRRFGRTGRGRTRSRQRSRDH